MLTNRYATDRRIDFGEAAPFTRRSGSTELLAELLVALAPLPELEYKDNTTRAATIGEVGA